MRGRLVEDRIEERICKIRLIDGVIANYYPQEELIRCKDCVKYKIFGDGYCPWIEQEVEEDFFCADGKRKEE